MGMAEAFLTACIDARGVLPKLRTGDPSHDAKDKALIQKSTTPSQPRMPLSQPEGLTMVQIAISQAAFDAIAATLALGTVAVEPERAENG